MLYAFEDFELDPGRNQLRRAGSEIEIQATPLRLLVYLVRHRDRAVPKNELLDEIWPDAIVSEAALSSALKEVRRALGDDGQRQRFVRTQRGFGYRFLPDVIERAPAPRVHPIQQSVQRSEASSAPHAHVVPPIGSEAPPRESMSGRPAAKPVPPPRGLARLQRVDRWLLLLGTPLWILCFAFNVQSWLGGTGYPPLGVPVFQPESEYPVLEVLAPIVSFEGSELRVGDRLIRVGPYDLQGSGSLDFFSRFVEAAEGLDFVDVEVERDGARLVTRSPVVSLLRLAPVIVPVSLGFYVIAVLVVLANPRSPVARALFHVGLQLAIGFVALFGGPPWKTGLSIALHLAAYAIGPPLVMRFLYLVPRGEPLSLRQRRSLWGVGLVTAAAPSMVLGFPFSMASGVKFFPPLYTVCMVALAWGFCSKYASSDPFERRQLKWFMYGGYAAILPPMLAFAWFALLGDNILPAVLAQVSFVLIPIAIYIGIARTNLFDIDRLISATVSLNLLLFAAIAAALVLAPRVAEVASNALGLDATTGQLAFAALLTTGMLSLQSKLRPRIEQWFFKDRHAIDTGIGHLLSQISSCSDAAALAQTTGDGLMALLKPQVCALYAREGSAFGLLYAGGAAVPPAIGSDTPLMATLQRKQTPLSLNERAGGKGRDGLDPFDRAVLDTLGAEVVVPIVRGSEVALILCLGAKNSGDVYTPTDVALLSSLAHTVSLALQRFDEVALGEETRRLEASLRRYVPGAVADAIDHGEELEAKTQEVSVLFVDLRNYTALSEAHGAEEIFSTVNRYTEAVSQLVREQGGVVVEFNGDGMMAVFGAPTPLPDKEASAVRAALAITGSIGDLPAPDGTVGALRAGVGIATGSAFVGNIRAVDRLIWSAIGNTTNLAARLEGLTRDLEADVVIDATTWERAGSDAADFEPRLRTPVRGRSTRHDLYVRPIGRVGP